MIGIMKPKTKVGNWTLNKFSWNTGKNIQYDNTSIRGLQLHVSKIYGDKIDYYSVHVYRYAVYYKSRFEKQFATYKEAIDFAYKYMKSHPRG